MSTGMSIVHKKSDPLLDYQIISTVNQKHKIYRAQHVGNGQFYAIKSVDLDSKTARTKSYIKNEPHMLFLLDHVNVIHLYDCYFYDHNMYLVLDLGLIDLYKFVSLKSYDRDLTYILFRQMAFAVNECHSKGVIHRDIKLNNFIIKEYDKTSPLIMLADFGYAKSASGLCTDYIGTPCYMAPEILSKIPYDGFTSDIWALGICLYYLYHKRLPFRTDNLSNLIHDINYTDPICDTDMCPQLKKLIFQCLHKNPQMRPDISSIITSEWFENGR